MYDERFMRRALACAKKAAALGEVPIGAVIVQDGRVVGSGYNRRETKKNALLHAEIIAIDRACKKLGGWRLQNCTMYVTLEPCPMCAGAIINARIGTVYVGAPDPKAGAFGGVCDLARIGLNHRPEVLFGYMQTESAQLLREFFKKLRNKNR